MLKILCLLVFTSFAASADVTWKSIFISGDDSIANFDNGRKTISSMLAPLGAHVENQQHLTSEKRESRAGVALATGENVVKAFKSMKVNKATDGCLVFMTSHGAKNQGFYLKQAGILPPQVLGDLVQAACGDAPTVVMISACYSGQFIAPALTGKNRIILTAARNDRPSFGCSADTKYTYWDECIIDNLPSSRTWKDLYAGVSSCISGKESQLGFQPSFPQAFFGENVKDLGILNQ
jgi:hypothetical protein